MAVILNLAAFAVSGVIAVYFTVDVIHSIAGA